MGIRGSYYDVKIAKESKYEENVEQARRKLGREKRVLSF